MPEPSSGFGGDGNENSKSGKKRCDILERRQSFVRQEPQKPRGGAATRQEFAAAVKNKINTNLVMWCRLYTFYFLFEEYSDLIMLKAMPLNVDNYLGEGACRGAYDERLA